MAPSVLVTGATGFIGRDVARAIAAAGCPVRALVRGDDAATRIAALGIPAAAHRGDLDDAESLATAVRGIGCVVHLAAIVDPALQEDASAVFRVNATRTLELARLGREAGVRRFVFVSSIAAVGFHSGVTTAETPCSPLTPYGRAKREAELGVLLLAGPGFDVTVLRPPTVYGPGEAYNFLAWVRAVESGLFSVIGRGENHFPLATTANVARAASAAALGQLQTGIYMVADREAYTMNRIDAAIRRALGRSPSRLRVPIAVAAAGAALNDALHRASPRVPLVLGRARFRTLTVDQRFCVEPLLSAGVDLDAPLEEWVDMTVRDYRRRGLLGRRD
jgi:UDP-N-acetyl-alpha-D-quinovosamine dehydrogenase